jgi:hypothetical protein
MPTTITSYSGKEREILTGKSRQAEKIDRELYPNQQQIDNLIVADYRRILGYGTVLESMLP